MASKTWQAQRGGAATRARSVWTPVKALLDTRLGPHVVFAVLLPLLASWLFGTALAMVAALWAMNHVAAVDARQKKYLERKVRAEELGKFQGRRGARQGGAA